MLSKGAVRVLQEIGDKLLNIFLHSLVVEIIGIYTRM
jgi:hypothetical protein